MWTSTTITRRLTYWGAITVVVIAYAVVGSGGGKRLSLTGDWTGSHYGSLTKGFRQGQLSMAHVPDPGLVHAANPYDPAARGNAPFLWDASYYRGKYYLYFSPVPVLILYFPLRAVTGAYPTDALAATIFALWAFFAWIGVLRRASEETLVVPASLWVVFLGLGNVTLFVLASIRMYEVAALCAAAFVGTWAYTIVLYRDRPTILRAGLSGTSLALAIATRPNLGVLLLIGGAPLLAHARTTRSWRHVLAWTVPLAVVAMGLFWYNYARFGSLREFGHKYQLTGVAMTDKRVCSVCGPGERSRFLNSILHYVFLPPVVTSQPPYARLQDNNVDMLTSYPSKESAVGIGPLVPISILGSVLLLLLGFAHRVVPEANWNAVLLGAGGWLVMIGLSTCWFVTTRYALDFMGLIIISSVLSIESSMRLQKMLRVPSWPLAVITSIFCLYSIIIGVLVALARDTPDGTLLRVFASR